MSYKTILKKAGRISLYVLTGILILLCLFMIFINIPAGRNIVKNQVQSYLRDKLKTKVVIGSIDYSLPKWIEINNVYIEDQKKDTLIFGERISVDIDMIRLLRGNTDIHKLVFKNILLNVNRREDDSSFNFQFVIDAFTGNKSSAQAKPDTAEMKLTMERLIFDHVALRFKDKNAGTDFYAAIKNLDASLNKFRPDRANFDINEFFASGVDFFMTSYKESKKDSLVIINTDTVKSSGYGLLISASKFDLRDVNVSVENTINGMYYANKVTHLGLSKVLFDLNRSTAIGDSLLLDSSTVRFNSPRKKKQISADITDTTSSDSWTIKAKQVSLNKNQFKYDDDNNPVSGGFDLAHLNVKDLGADISDFILAEGITGAQVKQLNFIDTSGFILDTTRINFLMSDTAISAKDMYVKTGQSLLQNSINIRFDSIGAISKDPKNSLVTAVLNNSTIAFNDLYLLFPFLKTSFPPGSFQNNLVHFNTELRGSLQRLYLPYLQISGLSGSSLSARGTLYNLTDPAKFYYDLYIDRSNIRKTDLLKFVPPGNKEAMAKLPEVLSLRGSITGNKTDMLSDVQINGKDIAINGRFSLKNISDPKRLQYDFAIRNSSFSKNFVIGFVPPGTIPPNIELPEKLSASGTFKGNENNFVADLKLNGSYGPATVKGYMKNMKDPAKASYDMLITLTAFQLGKLIKQDSIIGTFTGSVKAKGTGFDYKTMRSDITASIKQLQYNKYNYQDADIVANFNAGIISSKGSINDSSLHLQYDLVTNVRNEYPSINGTVNIDTAQLQRLHLYKDTLNFSLKANILANNLRPRNLDINTVVDSIKLQLGKNFYALDTVSLIATSTNGKDNINFNAPFANLQANGAFDYDRIGPAVIQYIDHYYHINGTKSATAIQDQQVDFDGVIKKHPFLTGVIPGLNAYEDINIKGSFSSANTDSALNLTVSVPYLDYQGNTTRNANIDIRSKNERLNYVVNFDTLNYAGNTFYGSRLNGFAANDSLSINGITQDNKKKDWFGLNASLFVKDDSYTFRLKDSLLLNYERWNVAKDNYISYSPAGIIIHNFSITSDTAKIFINSRQEIINSPIDIAIDNFNLKSISSIINADTLFASGILDAKMMVADLNKKIPAFTGNFTVTDLEIMQQPFGVLTGFAEKQSENNIMATMTLLGQGNDIGAKGNYYLNNDVHDFDANLDIRKFNVAAIQVFTSGAVKNASGNVYGNVSLDGKFSEPRWKGELNFDTTKFTITQLGTGFKINKQKILLDYPAVTLNDFIILDSLDHQMKVDGTVSVNQSKTYDLDIDINANDFIILNAPKAINNEFYGFAAIDANISVTGNSVSPDIEGDISVNDKSNVTIVIPERSYSKDAGKTIVRFIDRDTFDINPPVTPFVVENENKTAFAQFLNYNLNIEVNKKASLTIIIDPVTGDEIKVQGDAQLNAGVDPGGHLVLAGNYELNNGYYVFNYQFLQRKFNLEKGSTILFAGEPMKARINIAASYTVVTSAKDLLDNEVGNVDPLLANSFNQKVPFKVMLYLTGQLSKPVIKFDIQLPDENSVINSELRTTIENKLAQIRNDEASTNKQVFSLLLLGRFVGEQSSDFFKGNGDDFSDLARQSVSQFLSSALNEIAGNLLKGVDIDLNLNSYRDFSNGGNAQRTDLNVALSKTFLDDRLTVSVGKNFGVQGQDAVSKSTTSSFIPDVTISYKLTKDGKYLIRAYRKNQFEVVLDGYVVETGLGFVVTMDYEKFNELFRRKKKK
ncbi:MAG: translocation/assembly module TamB domain-containing protein [Ferruginibacter sp.]